MLKKIVSIIGGDPNQREIESHSETIDYINSLEEQYEGLTLDELRAKTDEFRARLAEGETMDDILPEAFATVREVSKRTLGLRHYDVQLIGGIAMHQGKIVEMRTGEGKTLVATLPLYLNALTGKGTHLITVNDYLARRDARWMAPIYDTLGLTVGVLQMASRTENGKKAFLVDLEKESPHEDQHQLQMVPRRKAYLADITYGTNSEFGFDYLRDNMTMRMEDRVQRGHNYAIIDEVDNVLIDEARTPLIISGPAQEEVEWYIKMAQVVKQLRPEDYEINERDKAINLTEIGETHVEEVLGMALRDPERPEDITHEQARLLGYLEQAMRAQYLFHRNKDYLVQAGKVVIVDEFTGRLMPGRRWSDGLHQAVEAKEGVRVQPENVTYATITIQNYFRMYDKLSGMTGTAVTESEEFKEIYDLDVLAIPTNLEYVASLPDTDLIALEARDESGYKYTYYTDRNDPEQEPIFWKRKDYPDVVYRTEDAKLRAIAREILRYHVLGRPLLVGTTSVELSERVSGRLKSDPIRRLAQFLLIRDVWFEKNNREEDGRQVPELEFMNENLDDLNISQMRRMARDLDISFNPEEESNLQRLLAILDLSPEHAERLTSALKAGISHEVLNARKHTEESQIIAGAGAYGAVTIATNMAGRGVDIKLGGELAEEILANVNRILHRNEEDDPYDMTFPEREQALLGMDPSDYGIYKSEIEFFLKFMDEMRLVRDLGGLHVIGSERHEARRIDNQLRGRSARQGDPGSSRFYLSMEDELMRLFGGQQADALMQRMRIDDAMPLEVGLVSRLVEQSQTRVEGANFDVRKHLLEYDDVLNSQRAKVYAQRDRIFTKDDLSEDVTDMLGTEVTQRVPESLMDEEGPWRLLSWLDQIQPTFTLENVGPVFPSYSLRLIVDDLHPSQDGKVINREVALEMMTEVARDALQAEEDHILHTVNQLLEQLQERLEDQLDERLEAMETFFEAIQYGDETDNRGSRELADELSTVVRMPLRLSSSQQRALRDDPDEVYEEIEDEVEDYLVGQFVRRLIGSVERRMEDSLDLEASRISDDGWEAVAEAVLEAIHNLFEKRKERYLGDSNDGLMTGGQIVRDLENALSKGEGPINRNGLVRLLMLMPQGARASFDKKTHRRVLLRTMRLNYVYYAARFLEDREPEEIAEDVLEHLENAQDVMGRAWGVGEFNRLASLTFEDMDKTTRQGLRNALGEDTYQKVYQQTLQDLDDELKGPIVEELGRQALTEIYRQLLLSVITELWVDYLTQMEALRVSIGLEAYAQRDPLVQYKNRAYGLFQDLLSNMRFGVITRMFTYRPRDLSRVQTTVTSEAAPTPQAVPETVPTPENQAPEPRKTSRSRKSKRRRGRRGR